jgi:hypothetical protein
MLYEFYHNFLKRRGVPLGEEEPSMGESETPSSHSPRVSPCLLPSKRSRVLRSVSPSLPRCNWNTLPIVLPQGLCTFCSFCLECPSLWYPHRPLPYSLPMWSHVTFHYGWVNPLSWLHPHPLPPVLPFLSALCTFYVHYHYFFVCCLLSHLSGNSSRKETWLLWSHPGPTAPRMVSCSLDTC